MSLYAQYIFEREGKETIENDRGFATFIFTDKGVYIEDIYVQKEFRQSGEAASLADSIARIAKDKGYSKLLGSVVPSAHGATSSLKVLLAYGFKLQSSTSNFIVLEKEI